MNVDPRLNEIKDCLYRVATKALIINYGKLLVVNEKDDDWWNLPGGGIDHGEEIEPSLVRELNEEIGLKPSDVLLIEGPVFVATNAEMDGVPRVNIFYKATVHIEAVTIGQDVEELQWCSPEEFLALPISPGISPYKKQIAALIK